MIFQLQVSFPLFTRFEVRGAASWLGKIKAIVIQNTQQSTKKSLLFNNILFHNELLNFLYGSF